MHAFLLANKLLKFRNQHSLSTKSLVLAEIFRGFQLELQHSLLSLHFLRSCGETGRPVPDFLSSFDLCTCLVADSGPTRRRLVISGRNITNFPNRYSESFEQIGCIFGQLSPWDLYSGNKYMWRSQGNDSFVIYSRDWQIKVQSKSQDWQKWKQNCLPVSQKMY